MKVFSAGKALPHTPAYIQQCTRCSRKIAQRLRNIILQPYVTDSCGCLFDENRAMPPRLRYFVHFLDFEIIYSESRGSPCDSAALVCLTIWLHSSTLLVAALWRITKLFVPFTEMIFYLKYVENF